jgi:hypothetical protein
MDGQAKKNTRSLLFMSTNAAEDTGNAVERNYIYCLGMSAKRVEKKCLDEIVTEEDNRVAAKFIEIGNFALRNLCVTERGYSGCPRLQTRGIPCVFCLVIESCILCGDPVLETSLSTLAKLTYMA